MTNTIVTYRRITKARRAMMNADNPQFKEYWRRVVDQLSDGLGN